MNASSFPGFSASPGESPQACIERLTRQLRETEERYRFFLENTTDGIWKIVLTEPMPLSLPEEEQFEWYYRCAMFAQCNVELARMYGFASPNALVGRSLRELMPPDRPENAEHMRQYIRSCYRLIDAESREVGADGRELVFLNNVIGLIDDGRLVSEWGTARDVTGRKRAEEALLAAKEEAEAANAAKDEFLAVLSHELRTPLTPVLMTLGALEQDAALRSEVREDLAMMRRNIELETRLIDDLLDLNHIKAGKLRLDMAPVALNDAVRQAVTICRPAAAESGVALDVELDPAAGFVLADAARLQQVLWNLVKNAIKFTPRDGRIVVRTEARDECCEVSVRDTGIGIEPEALPRIFDAFTQASATVTRQFGGLGLGLAICQALMRMHGGSLVARSEGPGCGASFHLELPSHSPASLPDTARVIPATPGPGLRLLIVDDHRDTLSTLSRLLARRGYTVHSATNVAEALEVARAHAFDVLVSDIGLPDGRGTELLAHLAREHGSMPAAIAMSGYGMEEDRQRSRAAGFAVHLTKPIDLAMLEQALARLAR